MTRFRALRTWASSTSPGSPALWFPSIAQSARYGLMALDVDAAVQAAVGGAPDTQIIEGDRRFDFAFATRRSSAARRRFEHPAADAGRQPGAVGDGGRCRIRNGAFMIYRENGRRYIPIKFSVRGRDLAGAIQDLQSRLATRSSFLPAMNIRGPVNSTALKRSSAGSGDRARQSGHDFDPPVCPVPHLARRFYRSGMLPFAAIGGVWLSLNRYAF